MADVFHGFGLTGPRQGPGPGQRGQGPGPAGVGQGPGQRGQGPGPGTAFFQFMHQHLPHEQHDEILATFLGLGLTAVCCFLCISTVLLLMHHPGIFLACIVWLLRSLFLAAVVGLIAVGKC